MNALSFLVSFSVFLLFVTAFLAGQKAWLFALDASFEEHVASARAEWFCLFAKDFSASGTTLLFFAPSPVNASCGLDARWSDGLVLDGR